jgi:hypothetical protein
MRTARGENARTLASLVGIGIREAETILDVEIAVKFDYSIREQRQLAGYISDLLRRTVMRVSDGDNAVSPVVEIILGSGHATSAQQVYVSISKEKVLIGNLGSSSIVSECAS